MAKTKKERADHYEEKVKLAENVKFEDLIKVAVKAPKKPESKGKK